MEDLAVEFLGEDDAYYKAYVYDVHEDSLSVGSERDSENLREVKFSQVRLTHDEPASSGNFTDFERVEVWCQASETDIGCWAPASIKMIKGDFVVLDYCATANSDIVPVERVRRPSKQSMLNKNTFHKFSIDVPADLREISGELNAHKEFAKACGTPLVRFVPDQSVLIIIALSERVIKKARMLSEMHLRNLRQKMVIRQHTEEAASKLANTQIKGFVEEFQVNASLMGLAIGGQGTNISKARDVPGVNNIELDELEDGCSTFRIYGESQEAVTEARTILEFVEDVIKVPKVFVAKIIGKNGRNIHDIVDKSGIARVKFQGENETPDNDNDEGLMSFIVVGTKESVNNANTLMEYNVSHLKEVEVLRLEKEGVDQRLKELTGVHTGNYFPYRERRGSSDFEGRGGYGYRSRGRGFRRRGNDRFHNYGSDRPESADEERATGYYTDSMVSNGRARGFYRRPRGRRGGGAGFFPRDNFPPSRSNTDLDRIPRNNQSSYTERRRMPEQDERVQDFNQDQGEPFRNRRRRINRRRDDDSATDTDLPPRGDRPRSNNNPRATDSSTTHEQPAANVAGANDSWADMNNPCPTDETTEKAPQRRAQRSNREPRKYKVNNYDKGDTQTVTSTPPVAAAPAMTNMVNGGDVSH